MSQTITIQPMADFAKAAQFYCTHQHAHPDLKPRNPDDFNAYQDQGFLLGAFNAQNQLIGMVAVRPAIDTDKTNYLLPASNQPTGLVECFFVASAYQNQHIGDNLLAHIHTQNHPFKHLSARVKPNSKSAALFEKHGFAAHATPAPDGKTVVNWTTPIATRIIGQAAGDPHFAAHP